MKRARWVHQVVPYIHSFDLFSATTVTLKPIKLEKVFEVSCTDWKFILLIWQWDLLLSIMFSINNQRSHRTASVLILQVFEMVSESISVHTKNSFQQIKRISCMLNWQVVLYTDFLFSYHIILHSFLRKMHQMLY